MSKITYGLFVLLAIAYVSMPKKQQQTSIDKPVLSQEYREKLERDAEQERIAKEANDPRKHVWLDYTWKRKYNILYLSGVIKNSSQRDIKDIEILCSAMAESGTALGISRKKMYKIIKKGKNITFENFQMSLIHSQTTDISCEISNFLYGNELIFSSHI